MSDKMKSPGGEPVTNKMEDVLIMPGPPTQINPKEIEVPFTITFPLNPVFNCNVPGIELRGLVKSCIHTIHVQSYIHRQDIIRVAIVMRVPDRFTDKLVRIEFQQDMTPSYDLIERGFTAEQAVVAQALRFLWEHELGEGVVINGQNVWDPERDHFGPAM